MLRQILKTCENSWRILNRSVVAVVVVVCVVVFAVSETPGMNKLDPLLLAHFGKRFAISIIEVMRENVMCQTIYDT